MQIVTNVHRIHHISWSYGWTFRPIRWAYFDNYGWQRLDAYYHDCTWSGVY